MSTNKELSPTNIDHSDVDYNELFKTYITNASYIYKNINFDKDYTKTISNFYVPFALKQQIKALESKESFGESKFICEVLKNLKNILSEKSKSSIYFSTNESIKRGSMYNVDLGKVKNRLF